MRYSRVIVACIVACCAYSTLSKAAIFSPGVSSNTVPWPGGVIPYEFDAAVTTKQQVPYLDGLKEWELAADIQFVPRSNQTQYLLLKYIPGGFINSVTGNMPQVMTLDTLSRVQVAHEMAHSLGLEHEVARPDRATFVTVFTNNLIPGNEIFYEICSNCTSFGSYDYESVVHFSRNLLSIDPANLDTVQPKPPNEYRLPKLGNLALSRGDRAAAAHLYGPPALLGATVTNTADGGVGSLRAACYAAADTPGTTVTFNIATSDPGYSNGIYRIRPTGALPLLDTPGTIIDATTQPGYSNHPLISIDGTAIIDDADNGVSGLTLYSSNCTIRGLGINRRFLGIQRCDYSRHECRGAGATDRSRHCTVKRRYCHDGPGSGLAAPPRVVDEPRRLVRSHQRHQYERNDPARGRDAPGNRPPVLPRAFAVGRGGTYIALTPTLSRRERGRRPHAHEPEPFGHGSG